MRLILSVTAVAVTGWQLWTWPYTWCRSMSEWSMCVFPGCFESNENVYRKFGMSSRGEGMNCGVVEMVKRSTLRWFGHLEGMDEREN